MAQLAEVSDLTDLAIAAHGGAVSAAAPLVGDAAAHLLACMGANQDTLRSVIATDSVPFHVAETLLRSFEPLLAAPAGVAAALQPPGGRLPDGAVSLDALVGLLCLLSRGSVTEKLKLVCWTLDREGTGNLQLEDLMRALPALPLVAAAARLLLGRVSSHQQPLTPAMPAAAQHAAAHTTGLGAVLRRAFMEADASGCGVLRSDEAAGRLLEALAAHLAAALVAAPNKHEHSDGGSNGGSGGDHGDGSSGAAPLGLPHWAAAPSKRHLVGALGPAQRSCSSSPFLTPVASADGATPSMSGADSASATMAIGQPSPLHQQAAGGDGTGDAAEQAAAAVAEHQGHIAAARVRALAKLRRAGDEVRAGVSPYLPAAAREGAAGTPPSAAQAVTTTAAQLLASAQRSLATATTHVLLSCGFCLLICSLVVLGDAALVVGLVFSGALPLPASLGVAVGANAALAGCLLGGVVLVHCVCGEPRRPGLTEALNGPQGQQLDAALAGVSAAVAALKKRGDAQQQQLAPQQQQQQQQRSRDARGGAADLELGQDPAAVLLGGRENSFALSSRLRTVWSAVGRVAGFMQSDEGGGLERSGSLPSQYGSVAGPGPTLGLRRSSTLSAADGVHVSSGGGGGRDRGHNFQQSRSLRLKGSAAPAGTAAPMPGASPNTPVLSRQGSGAPLPPSALSLRDAYPPV